jgi:hypothetical protein
MDDPTRRCENDTGKWKRATRGSCSQARAPLFCPEWDSHFWLSAALPISGIQLIDLLGRRNVQLMQHVENFSVAQS